nr:Lip3594 [uncultured bacterium]
MLHVILFFLGILFLLFLAGILIFKFLDRTNGTLGSASEIRSYLLYVPKSYNAARPMPLVITIHGFVQWPAHQMRISRWNDLADEQGFIVVYPSGTHFPKRWRTRAAPSDDHIDPTPDIVFIADLIEKLNKEYKIDPERIYVNGLSNGGGMAFLVACELADRIAAVGMVAAALPVSWEHYSPVRPVPAMIFHGTADPIVPYLGSSGRYHISLPSIPEWVATLAKHYGCDGASRKLPTVGKVTGIEYNGCAANVIFYTIEDGGHNWPGGRPIPAWITGPTNMDIDATRILWEFFQKHPLKESSQAIKSSA